MKKRKILPPHSWEAHPLTEQGEVKKSYLIAVITVVAVVVLFLFLFLGKPLVGKAFFSPEDTPLNQAGIFVVAGTKERPEVPFAVPITANLGAAKSVGVSFTLNYDDAVFDIDCAAVQDTIFDQLDAKFIQEGNDLTLVRAVDCAVPGTITLEYAGLCADADCTNALTEAEKIAEIEFTATAESPGSPISFTSFEILSLDEVPVNLVPTVVPGTIVVEREVVLPPGEVTINSCGFTAWEEGGVYVLDADLVLAEGIRTCLEPNQNNIQLSCAGHSLTGTKSTITSSPTAGLVLSNVQGISISDCTITGFNNGIVLRGASENTISGNTVAGNDRGIALAASGTVGSNSNLIENNLIRENGLVGLLLRNSANTIIRGNSLSANTRGIDLDSGSSGTQVVDTQACGSTTEDLFCSSDVTASGTNNAFTKVNACDNSWPSLSTDYTKCPTGLDSDTDSITDTADNCPAVSNPGQANSDGDALGDACDTEADQASCSDAFDNDGDSIVDCADDSCNGVLNEDSGKWCCQAATDCGEGYGLVCENNICLVTDTDNDGIVDGSDTCPVQFGSVSCTVDTAGCINNDPDNDLKCLTDDNCLNDANADQADEDIDGVGDACDTDFGTGATTETSCTNAVDDDSDGDIDCDDSDCVADAACAAAECSADADCESGDTCVDGTCLTLTPPCRFNTDCSAGESCVDGTCGIACTTNADCLPTIENSCSGSLLCAVETTYTCTSGLCQAAASSDESCEACALGCDNNACVLITMEDCADADGDGINSTGSICGPVDCDDTNSSVWLNQTGYYDQDGDGYGSTTNSSQFCTDGTLSSGYLASGNDCGDTNPSTHPGAADAPGDGIDQDCSGSDATAVSTTDGGGGGGGGGGSGGGRRCQAEWKCGDWKESYCNVQLLQTRTCIDLNNCEKNRVENQSCAKCDESWVCSLWSECVNGINDRTCIDEHQCSTVEQKPALQKGCQQAVPPGPAPGRTTYQQPYVPPPAPALPPAEQKPESFWSKYQAFLIGIPAGLVLIALVVILVLHYMHRGKSLAYNVEDLKNWIKKEKAMGTSNEDIKSILKHHTGWTDQEISGAFKGMK